MFESIFGLLRDVFVMMSHVMGRSSFPTPLSPEEERQNILAMVEGDEDARMRLIERNLRLVAHIAKKYINSGHEQDDLISVGTIGLIKAIKTFKPEKDIQLATYAARCIENEILMTIRSAKKQKKVVSLHDPIGSDREGNEITLIDILGTDPDCVPDEVGKAFDLSRVAQLVRTILTKRERLVVELRYGMRGYRPYAQREIAEMLGISRSYVSRIEKKAIGKLNEALQ